MPTEKKKHIMENNWGKRELGRTKKERVLVDDSY